MGCVLCDGADGLFAQSDPADVAQALHVELRAKHGDRLRNIVMMGMGELRNFGPTMDALDILTDTGLNIGPRVISTVGYVPYQEAHAAPKRYSLAVSLHGASDEERGKLIPINKRWPLAEFGACRSIPTKRARVFFAWTLIKNLNDSDDHAPSGQSVGGMDAHVNLIRNPTRTSMGRPPTKRVCVPFSKSFRYRLPSTVRQRRGIDVAAGCGQLKAKHVSGIAAVSSLAAC